MTLRWFIITGEYPPQPGGISDYTRVVASALANAGDVVEIWTGPLPDAVSPVPDRDGIRVHRTADHFGRRARAEIGAALARLPGGTRVLLQYEPWSFGARGINLPFAWWVRQQKRQRPDLPLDVMFHEVATGGPRFKEFVHGLLTRAMAALTARVADRVFMSVPVWEPVLRPLLRADQRAVWLPVPSNVPRMPDASRAVALREELLERCGVKPERSLLVGHFSTFRGEIPAMLRGMVPRLLENPSAVLLLLGRGGKEFAASLAAAAPVTGRIIAGGEMDLEGISEHLAACDLLVQPYPDGVSSRRTTTMAGLNAGCPIVTNFGHCSDTGLWAESGAVRLVNSIDPGQIAAAAVQLMERPDERTALQTRAREFYDERFSVSHVLEVLRGISPPPR